MTKRSLDADAILRQAKPLTHQHAHEIQPYGHLVKLPIALAENVCEQSVDNLNQVLADTMTLRDLYKKHHWQVAGPTFYQLHLLFDKHFERAERARRRDRRTHPAARRRQPGDGARHRRDDADPPPAQGTRRGAGPDLPAPACARDRPEGSAHDGEPGRRRGDDGTNDLLVSDVIRTNELQVWFVAEHVVDMPLVRAV